MIAVAAPISRNDTRNKHGFARQYKPGMPIIFALDTEGRLLSRVNGLHPDARWKVHKGKTRLSQIVQSRHGKLYALQRGTGEVLRREAMNVTRPTGRGWKQIVGRLTSIAVTNAGGLWGTNEANNIFYKAPTPGSTWQKIDGELRVITAGLGVLGLDKDGRILARQDVTFQNATGSSWKVLAPMTGDPSLAHLATGSRGQLWAVTKEGEIVYKTNLTVVSWTSVPVPEKIESLTLTNDGSVAAVTRTHALLFRRGVNATYEIGRDWMAAPANVQPIKFGAVTGGNTFRPLEGSQLLRPTQARAHVGRGLPRTFDLLFEKLSPDRFNRTARESLAPALARLAGISPRRIQPISAHVSTITKDGVVGRFKILRREEKKSDKKKAGEKKKKKGDKKKKKGKKKSKKGDKKKKSKKGGKKKKKSKNGKKKKNGKKDKSKKQEADPANALKQLKLALMDKETVRAETALVKTRVDPTSLYLVKPNGKRIKVTTPARRTLSRAEKSRDPNDYKLVLSTIAHGANPGWIFDGQPRHIRSETLTLVYATRKLANDTRGLKSQQWIMNFGGQLYYKDTDGDRQCLDVPDKVKAGVPVTIRMCSASRDERQIFAWSRVNGRLTHVQSGKCVTSANRVPRDQDTFVLDECVRGGSKKQTFVFQPVPAAPVLQGGMQRLVPAEADYNITFRVDFEKDHQRLAKDFVASVRQDLSEVIGIAKRRVAIHNVTAVPTETPTYDSRFTITLVASEEGSGDKSTKASLVVLRAMLASNTSQLLSRDSWKRVHAKSFVVLTAPPTGEIAPNTTSKIEYFLAPGHVIDGGFGGRPGTELVLATYNVMSKSQAWYWMPKIGKLYWQDEHGKQWCITTPPRANITDGAKLTTRPCLNASDEHIALQQFSYDRTTQSFTHRLSEKCLELLGRNTVTGTPIVLAKCGPASNAQSFDFPASYPSDMKKQLAREAKKEAKIEAQANKVVEQSLRQEGRAKLQQAKAKEEEAKILAKEKADAAKAEQAKKERIQFMQLRKALPKTQYLRRTKTTTYGKSSNFVCRDLSNYFGIAHAETIGFHTPALYRSAWTAKRCATKPLTCQELTDCYDFANVHENNAWALKNGFKVNATEASFKFAPLLVASRYFGLFKHGAHAHGFHGAAEHANTTGSKSSPSTSGHGEHFHAREHGHAAHCKGFKPLDCQQMSDYYGISNEFVGTAPKCVQAKFKYLACRTAPEQTCQVLSNRYGLKPGVTTNSAPVSSSVAVAAATSPAEQVIAETGYIPPQEAVRAFIAASCTTVPMPCQNISGAYQTWPGHQGKASKDTYRQFLLHNCTTRPMMTCAQLSDSFLFGSAHRHPRPLAHGVTSEMIGNKEWFLAHVTASENSLPTTFVELASTAGASAQYNRDSLNNAPLRKIPAAYFIQWSQQRCQTRPHSCQQLSDIYGISPSNQGAASKAIARTFSAVKGCSTHPMLSCGELSTIYGMTSETVDFTAAYLQRQWRAQNCTTSVSSCQELSDAYDLPNGEWASYAPKGVHAQFKALGCKSTPLPTCQALSDWYFINHAQIDPSKPSEHGLADRLILAKYSRWSCHHTYRECQEISNVYGIGRSKTTGKIEAHALVPQYARDLYQYRQCGTNPIQGVAPGAH